MGRASSCCMPAGVMLPTCIGSRWQALQLIPGCSHPSFQQQS
jgi:hypothetical protein